MEASTIFPPDKYLVAYRPSRASAVRYYSYFDGHRGKAVAGPKEKAVEVNLATGLKVVRQLEARDNRGWRLVYKSRRCRIDAKQPFELAAQYPRYLGAITV